jgi:hypothetical protein
MKTVRIGALDYQVVEVERLQADDRSALIGLINTHELVIQVETRLDPQMKLTTVWHETLHGLLCQAGIDEHDEKTLEVLSYGIVQVLRDNPQLAPADKQE